MPITFSAQEDPLGVGLRQRAADYQTRWKQAAEENARQHGQLVSFSLPTSVNSMWDPFFQAMAEAGASNVGQAETKRWNAPALPSTAGPDQTPSDRYSAQIGTPGLSSVPFGQNPGFDAIMRLLGRR